jgi:gluconokinase
MNDPDGQAEERDPSPRALVVMGVCGAGKTEIGKRLAEALQWTFVDADDFHPPANVEKMRAGTPLTDADRWPWLDALAAELRDATAGRGTIVLACSALTRRYRDRLGLPNPRIRLVHLDDPSGVIRQRMERRAGHFMPTALLDSQLALLERPTPDERPTIVDVASEPGAIVRSIVAAFHWDAAAACEGRKPTRPPSMRSEESRTANRKPRNT